MSLLSGDKTAECLSVKEGWFAVTALTLISQTLSMTECGLHMDGWLLYARLCAHAKISP